MSTGRGSDYFAGLSDDQHLIRNFLFGISDGKSILDGPSISNGHLGGVLTNRCVGRPLIVGVVHGLAGSAAVALLVLTAIRNRKWAVVYLLVFWFGMIAGMMLITVAIAVPLASIGKRSSNFDWGLRVASGLISLGFGCFIVYQIGLVNGLFTGHLQWNQR